MSRLDRFMCSWVQQRTFWHKEVLRLRLIVRDQEYSRANSGRILVVAYTERGERIRLISARVVTRVERKLYEEG